MNKQVTEQNQPPFISHKSLGIILFSSLTALIIVIIIVIVFNRGHHIPPKLTLTIAATNDIHGSYYSTLLSRKDTGQRYKYGGLDIMAKMVQILKNENKNHFLYLDAGDQFQGGLQSSKLVSSGQIMADFYNHIKVSASVPGNHQFDFSQTFLQNYLKKLNTNTLSANLIDSKLNSTDPKYYPLYKQQLTRMFSFPIQPNPQIAQNLTELKIGVIGLTTIETPYKTSGFVEKLFPGTYKFLKYKQVILNQSKILRKKGAHAIFVVGHVGNQCGINTDYGIWSEDKMGNITQCQQNDEVFQMIDSLPKGTIQAVIQGHRHSTSHYFYKGIPIIGTINGGYYLNALKLKFTIQGQSVTLDPKQIQIEGPIPVCQKIFQNTKKCQYVSPQKISTVGKLINWNFHGVKVQKDNQLSVFVQTKWGLLMKKYQIQICSNFIPYPIGKDYVANTPIGKLITNLLASQLKKSGNSFDFIILNAGGFRTTWYPGVIRYAQLHLMLPFDNYISYFDITGINLKKLLTTINNGQKRFYPQWGLSQTYQMNSTSQKYDLINLVLANGSPIIDSQIYRGVTIKFLLDGGDDFKDQQSLFTNINNTSINIKRLIQLAMQQVEQITQDQLKNPSNLERITVFQ